MEVFWCSKVIFNVYQLIFIKLFYIRIHFHFILYENKATIKEGDLKMEKKSFKIRSVNDNEQLWTKLADQMETLENRDEMKCFNCSICCDNCCFNCCFQI